MKIVVRFINIDKAEETSINQNFSPPPTVISGFLSSISLVAEEINLCWLFHELFLIN